VPYDLPKWCWQYRSNSWSIWWGSVIVFHCVGCSGSSTLSLLRPPGDRGFMKLRTSPKHLRFSSARLRCMMSLRLDLSFVWWAASRIEFRCSCRLDSALRHISRSCRRIARRLAEMVFPFSGDSGSLSMIRASAVEKSLFVLASLSLIFQYRCVK